MTEEQAEKSPGGKVSPEEAGVVRLDAHCIDCANWTPESGECSKVEGVFDAEDGCGKYFEPEHDEAGESAADEAAEAAGADRASGMERV